MIQMLGQVTNLIMPKFIARKPKIKHGTYNKYGFAITLHQYCICPRCNHRLYVYTDRYVGGMYAKKARLPPVEEH